MSGGRRGSLLLPFVLAGGTAACAGSPGGGATTAAPAEIAAPARPADPASAFAELEEALLEDPVSPIAFRITSEGAFAAELVGELRLGPGEDAALTAEGTFGQDSVALSLAAADGRLTGGNGERRFDQAIPQALREALALGLTRMGVLHNLARLVGGAPPDGADGTFAGRVQTRAHAWTAREGEGGEPSRHGIAFELWVQGQHTADAVLWLDALGRPVARDQTVRFTGGEMHVREAYGTAAAAGSGR